MIAFLLFVLLLIGWQLVAYTIESARNYAEYVNRQIRLTVRRLFYLILLVLLAVFARAPMEFIIALLDFLEATVGLLRSQ